MKRLTIVSYAVYRIPRIRDALVAAANRGVSIRLIIEMPNRIEGQGEYDCLLALGDKVASACSVYFWPQECRPKEDMKLKGFRVEIHDGFGELSRSVPRPKRSRVAQPPRSMSGRIPDEVIIVVKIIAVRNIYSYFFRRRGRMRAGIMGTVRNLDVAGQCSLWPKTAEQAHPASRGEEAA